jgi:para-aminobenzoate synthetase/4-amino-4-deoxychorismate lyase
VIASFTPTIRFDNMRDFTTTTLEDFEGELRADVLSDVEDVLARAEDAARRGRWVAGYVSYEAAPAFDGGLRVRPRDSDRADHVPLVWFGMFHAATTSRLSLPHYRRSASHAPWTPRIHEDDYVKKVQSILDEIEVGNVYQVNLTNTLVRKGATDARALYRQLLIAQQPAYGSLIELEGAAIVSASPELFVDWNGTVLCSRPMKGTARRGTYRKEDEARAKALVNSPKESAENIMIVDLIRNDMGKVAEIGTVTTTELQTLEAYPNVWQLVSEIQCQTRRDVGLVDIFRAMFPCGSVTGAPKQSAMEIIERLEVSERGVYCGTVGLLEPVNGGLRARFSVAIRTAVIANTEARYGSGGGVVAASNPESEFSEMALKAEMLGAEPTRPFRLLETFGYGNGASMETFRAHLQRMRASAMFFGFRCPANLETRVISKLQTSHERVRIRLMLSRSGEIEVQCGALPLPRATPVRLAIDDEPICSDSTMLFHKTTLRHPYDRRRRKFPRADDVVMINERGECTETTIANIAARVGGAWITPPLSSGCLPGIGRAQLIDEGVLVEAVLRPEDLRGAEEVAVVNSLRGWQRATLLAAEEPSSAERSAESLDLPARI